MSDMIHMLILMYIWLIGIMHQCKYILASGGILNRDTCIATIVIMRARKGTGRPSGDSSKEEPDDKIDGTDEKSLLFEKAVRATLSHSLNDRLQLMLFC